MMSHENSLMNSINNKDHQNVINKGPLVSQNSLANEDYEDEDGKVEAELIKQN